MDIACRMHTHAQRDGHTSRHSTRTWYCHSVHFVHCTYTVLALPLRQPPRRQRPPPPACRPRPERGGRRRPIGQQPVTFSTATFAVRSCMLAATGRVALADAAAAAVQAHGGGAGVVDAPLGTKHARGGRGGGGGGGGARPPPVAAVLRPCGCEPARDVTLEQRCALIARPSRHAASAVTAARNAALPVVTVHGSKVK